MKPFVRTLGAVCAAATLVTAASCATVQQTGRRQLLLVTESQEMSLGAQEYQAILKESKLSTDREKIALVQRVGERIARVAKQPDFKWEFRLIDDDSVANAFCLPGGKIAVYTGLLALTKTEAGLAAVMGHEVAHATARHGGERVSQGMLAQLGDQAILTALGKRDPAVVNAVRGAYGVGAQLGVLLPFSRQHETEADRIGLEYMAAAGYDPREAVAFWQRMAQAGGAGAPEFLSTHPAHSTRVAELQKAMPRALQIYARTQTR